MATLSSAFIQQTFVPVPRFIGMITMRPTITFVTFVTIFLPAFLESLLLQNNMQINTVAFHDTACWLTIFRCGERFALTYSDLKTLRAILLLSNENGVISSHSSHVIHVVFPFLIILYTQTFALDSSLIPPIRL